MAKYLNLKMILLTGTPCCSPSFIALKGSETEFHYKILANYNGQAELLLSLQIPPDYFPYQFKQRGLYDYLTHINRYLVTEGSSAEKQGLGDKIQGRINQLVGKVTTFGPSLWNEDLYAGGLVNRNVQFWNTKSADYLFLEQFILDDSSDFLFLIQRLPKHSHLAVTNFRAARDPYSLFGEDVYRHFVKNGRNGSNAFATKLLEYYRKYSKISPNSLFRSAKYIEFWSDFCSDLQQKSKENGYSGDLSSLFSIPSSKEQLFAPFGKKEHDRHIAQKFFEAIFTEEELNWLKDNGNRNGGGEQKFEFNYLKKNGQVQGNGSEHVCPSALHSQFEQVHHPALEHQTMKGSSPVSEGTQKELFVYLAQMAIALDKMFKTSNFSSVFNGDSRQEFIKKAWSNAIEIAKNYRERLKNVRSYLQKIKVVDEGFDPEQKKYSKNNSKTLAIISYPPSQLGAGDATIQTISKYPFLYTELGLKEVIPKNLTENGEKHEMDEDLLGVDDNGWWWKLGDFNFSSKGLDSFSKTADSIILLATEDDWNILNAWDSPKLRSLKSLLNHQEDKYITTSNYHLWNEGLRSPIALNLLLDVLVKSLTKQFGTNGSHQEEYKKALSWGNYWETTFVNGTTSNLKKS